MAEKHDQSHHITPISTYAKTFGVLTILMVLTVAAAQVNVAHYLPVSDAAGSYINNTIAMVIAVIKAVLVVLFFMGVKYSTSLTKLWAGAGFVWLLLMTIIYGDYATRQWEPVRGWVAGEHTTESRSIPKSDARIVPLKEQKRLQEEAAEGGGH